MSTLPKFFLVDYSKDDANWDRQRSASQSTEALYASADFSSYRHASYIFQRYAERMGKCSNILKFGLTDDNKIKLKQTFFCRVRYCPVCQWRRSMMWRARFFQIMPEIVEKYPTHRWVFLTLTVKNCPISELRDTLNLMSKSWNRFIKLKKLSFIDGFVRTTEVTRGKDGSAHPHYHCLLLVKPSFFAKSYIKNDEWREVWGNALQVDYLPVTHVKAVKGASPDKAVLETLKYSTKPDDFFEDTDWFLQLTQQTHKLRFVATGGVLKNCLKPEDEITNEDMIHADASDDEAPTDERRIAFFYNDEIRRYHRATKYDENFEE